MRCVSCRLQLMPRPQTRYGRCSLFSPTQNSRTPRLLRRAELPAPHTPRRWAVHAREAARTRAARATRFDEGRAVRCLQERPLTCGLLSSTRVLLRLDSWLWRTSKSEVAKAVLYKYKYNYKARFVRGLRRRRAQTLLSRALVPDRSRSLSPRVVGEGKWSTPLTWPAVPVPAAAALSMTTAERGPSAGESRVADAGACRSRCDDGELLRAWSTAPHSCQAVGPQRGHLSPPDWIRDKSDLNLITLCYPSIGHIEDLILPGPSAGRELSPIPRCPSDLPVDRANQPTVRWHL